MISKLIVFLLFLRCLDIVFQYMAFIIQNNPLISFRVRKAYDFQSSWYQFQLKNKSIRHIINVIAWGHNRVQIVDVFCCIIIKTSALNWFEDINIILPSNRLDILNACIFIRNVCAKPKILWNFLNRTSFDIIVAQKPVNQ